MNPFLRPADSSQEAVPEGWTARPAGLWAGRAFVLVYDPNRHDVLVVRARSSGQHKAAFRSAGYRRVAIGGPQEMWVRDRATTVQASLRRLNSRTSEAASLGLGGLGE